MAEELDDDVYDNWEDLVDTGALDKKLEVMKSKISEQCSNCRSNSESFGCVTPVIIQDESHRTPYIPPQPQVKILKRPTAGSKGDGPAAVNGDKTQKQPMKTLQQREAEYAEARLRILGAAKSEEEVAEERLSKLTLAVTADGSRPDEPECSNNPFIEYVKLMYAAPRVEVIRAPRGPDGTPGFTQFR